MDDISKEAVHLINEISELIKYNDKNKMLDEDSLLEDIQEIISRWAIEKEEDEEGED